MSTVLAFDLGASSGRAIRATFDGKRLQYEEIHRFDNVPLQENGHICHDLPRLLQEIETALSRAGQVDALAFDTWGVDYGLLDGAGAPIASPVHYRDGRTGGAVERAAAIMDADTLYRETGNQIMPINTLFQLTTDENLEKADRLLFIPDLLASAFTGRQVSERTVASTSQLFDPKTGGWNTQVAKAFGIDPAILPELVDNATVIGEWNGIPVVAAAGHDTQCAVAAMCAEGEHTAFLSCGTWSLIGCELDEPVLTPESRKAELSNEWGANGRINYLKNISGLWLIQETRRDLRRQGREYSYNELEQQARASAPFARFIDPDAPELSAHGDLPAKIADYCRATGQTPPATVGELVRCVYESLALKYRLALEQITAVTGKTFDTLNLLGGGVKDGFLCELTAKSLGFPVVAGPTEATALGNILLQLVALGDLPSVEAGREMLRRSVMTKTYQPTDRDGWDAAYARYKQLFSHE